MLQFDYVVVGAGTAGCLMANRLSAGGKHTVLLLEAGGSDNYHWIHIPVGYLYCIGNPRTDWLYTTQAAAGLNGRSLRYPRGKVLGGCSSINGMIYMRGQARDYDGWAAATGDDAWRWEHCLPDFKRHESHHALDVAQGLSAARELAGVSGADGAAAFHGQGGEWRVEKQRLRWDILDAFAAAANGVGIPSTPDFNRGDNAGVGYFEVNQRSGWRWNAAKAFLRPALRRASQRDLGRNNLTLWKNAHAVRLILGDAGQNPAASQVNQPASHADSPSQSPLRCQGVEVLYQGQKVQVRAHKEVVLCAGAIGTPQILQRSGIGEGERLHPLGITPAVELPGVGQNLQDHLQIRAVYKVRGTQTLNTLANGAWGKFKIGLEYALRRSGPMSMAPSQLGAFTKSDPAQPHANLQYHVQPLSLDAFGEPLHSFDAFTASVCNLNPTSRGSVQLASSDPAAAPLIAPNYLSTDADRLIAAQSLRLTRRIVAQEALKAYAPEEFKPGVQYQSDEDLARLAGDIATTIFHPVGTAKMGRSNDPSAVVNSRLQLFNGRGGTLPGLRVADASVMPHITSGNTNSPTLMIAEKAADWMLGSGL